MPPQAPAWDEARSCELGRPGARFARAERERRGAPARSGQGSRLEPQPGTGGHHRRAARAHGRDDLLGVDPLQVDRGGAEVGVAELALDDVERDALTGEFERMPWRSWCGAKRRLTPARAASRRNSLRTAAPDHGRPRVGPSMMQNSGPTGSSARAFSHGRICSQPHSSMPTSRRRPPLPLRTSTDPRR